jgi:tetratricopeptide (TPR) repeat protein
MYQEAQQLGSLSAAIFAKLARAYAAMHRYRLAISEYAKAVRLQPDDTDIRLCKVDLLLRVRDLSRASADLDECESFAQVRPRHFSAFDFADVALHVLLVGTL